MALKAHLDPRDNADTDERRDPRRHLLLETSGAAAGGEEANVVVHNVSAGGMLIETSLPLDRGEILLVELPQAGGVAARVVWASGILFGCQFEEALSPAALSAVELRASAPLPPEIGLPAPRRRIAGEHFGKRIEQLRKRRSLTLEQVANRLGVSKPTVWAWEKGKARPIEERLPALAEVLGVEPEELASFAEPPGISELVQTSRERIAAAYGTTPSKVRIMIDL